ncbi:hypothetical protein GCM10029976_025520 [Kribbella albertanoniae]|uniref:Uncharacterized protein n=1 Tax=Kribbella albertanoniae TaxID=1266829 RepID=A0A4R4PH91_9ACTN|nr:hypothetical protein [Kribbella albertanoniae]TDC21331.1 hypothetical protein E1261_33575 [Kribbella albertanoniae]
MSEGGDPTSAAAPAVTVSRALRSLFDFNDMGEHEGKWGWLWWIARIALFGLGSLVGGQLWELATGDPERSFLERGLTNAYIWLTLLTTGLYALYDRRSR